MAYRGGHAGGRSYGNGDTSQNLMELENNRRINLLGDQVSALKAISRDIHDEVESQTSLLDKMDDQMGGASEMLSRTMDKLDKMLKTGGMKNMFYLIGFVVFVFLVVWYTMKFRS